MLGEGWLAVSSPSFFALKRPRSLLYWYLDEPVGDCRGWRARSRGCSRRVVPVHAERTTGARSDGNSLGDQGEALSRSPRQPRRVFRLSPVVCRRASRKAIGFSVRSAVLATERVGTIPPMPAGGCTRERQILPHPTSSLIPIGKSSGSSRMESG